MYPDQAPRTHHSSAAGSAGPAARRDSQPQSGRSVSARSNSPQVHHPAARPCVSPAGRAPPPGTHWPPQPPPTQPQRICQKARWLPAAAPSITSEDGMLMNLRLRFGPSQSQTCPSLRCHAAAPQGRSSVACATPRQAEGSRGSDPYALEQTSATEGDKTATKQ